MSEIILYKRHPDNRRFHADKHVLKLCVNMFRACERIAVIERAALWKEIETLKTFAVNVVDNPAKENGFYYVRMLGQWKIVNAERVKESASYKNGAVTFIED